MNEPQQPEQRRWSLTVPISPGTYVYLDTPQVFTLDQWHQFMEVWEAMKPGLLAAEPDDCDGPSPADLVFPLSVPQSGENET